MTDLDTIRERHVEMRSQTTGKGKGICNWCGDTGSTWPCDTRVVLDALDEMQGRLLLMGAPDRPMSKAEVDRAMLRTEEIITAPYRADADRLAEALREVARENHDPTGTKWHHPGTRYLPCSFDECQDPDCEAARDALRQHEALGDE